MKYMKNEMTSDEILSFAREIMYIESDAIKNVADTLNHSFFNACKLILESKGKLITIGIGKSGHIAKVISVLIGMTILGKQRQKNSKVMYTKCKPLSILVILVVPCLIILEM